MKRNPFRKGPLVYHFNVFEVLDKTVAMIRASSVYKNYLKEIQKESERAQFNREFNRYTSRSHDAEDRMRARSRAYYHRVGRFRRQEKLRLKKGIS